MCLTHGGTEGHKDKERYYTEFHLKYVCYCLEFLMNINTIHITKDTNHHLHREMSVYFVNSCGKR